MSTPVEQPKQRKGSERECHLLILRKRVGYGYTTYTCENCRGDNESLVGYNAYCKHCGYKLIGTKEGHYD